MLPLTIAVGRLGTDRVDDGGERLVAVPVGALVVREVGRPHHPVDADAVDELEPQSGSTMKEADMWLSQ